MKIKCVWEHNGSDSLLYAENCVGAFTRGESVERALAKMPGEIQSYYRWLGEEMPGDIETVIVQEKLSELEIRDADSDVLFETERAPLTLEEYHSLKELALKSAEDFWKLYESIPDKKCQCIAGSADLLWAASAHGRRDVSAYEERQQLLFW